MNAEELMYCPTHEWVSTTEENGETVATVGISAFAVEQLTDLVYMELPSVGNQVAAGQEFGEVESVKAVSPMYSPVSGEVIAVNDGLADQLETLNDDPYTAGWIMKVKLSGALPDNLLDFAAYQKQCAESS
ncbi:MAG TPA: glycine cleavage system protein GcvH [Planctomycetes bacterium]|nr:glycine cleavage system protein GcvH [Planctomycetaceae bacterium]HIN54851.1 glycine cleavage system protein GcvH [Planctomycetota bacterium]